MFYVYLRVAAIIAILFGTCMASVVLGGFMCHAYGIFCVFMEAETAIAAVFAVLAFLSN